MTPPGLLVARRVRELAGAEMEVLELEGEPARLLDAWEGAGWHSSSTLSPPAGSPGSDAVRRHRRALPRAATAASTHALGLGDLVELGRALGRLPARLIVFGIEGAGFEAGAPPSAAVMSAVDLVADAIVAGAARR